MKAQTIIKIFRFTFQSIGTLIVLSFAWFIAPLISGFCFAFSLLAINSAIDDQYGEESQNEDLKVAGILFLYGIGFLILVFIQAYFGAFAMLTPEIRVAFNW